MCPNISVLIHLWHTTQAQGCGCDSLSVTPVWSQAWCAWPQNANRTLGIFNLDCTLTPELATLECCLLLPYSWFSDWSYQSTSIIHSSIHPSTTSAFIYHPSTSIHTFIYQPSIPLPFTHLLPPAVHSLTHYPSLYPPSSIHLLPTFYI